MNETKLARIEKAKVEAAERKRKAIVSLAHCLSRSDVMRLHHDLLVKELADTGAGFTDAKKVRFMAYTCFWFASLAAVIERYQQLSTNGTIPTSGILSTLITDDFVDLLKPFRNAVAHCSDHDDQRVLNLFEQPNFMPDRAEQITDAFHTYFQENGFQYA
jgi:hypothetical protein